MKLYIGLMSGTSADAINAALVDFNSGSPQLIDHDYQPFSAELQQTILKLCHPGMDEINRLGEMDVRLGKLFAESVLRLLQKNGLTSADIAAIGSHGQTIRHHPARQFTLQIGDPNIIAAETGITTVADFRRRDIALGGQGAPLVPAFHKAVFANRNADRVIVNIGGIANVTLLQKNGRVLGFDTGPGNILLDAWTHAHLKKPFDEEGAWARQGTVNEELLNHFLQDDYFKRVAPKSAGHEDFNLEWATQYSVEAFSPVDVQATLVELTAKTIVAGIKHFFSEGEIYICGGGAHNRFLLERVAARAKPLSVQTTDALHIPPDWVEAMAFAWLAYQTLREAPGNIIEVTGAKKESILGGIYLSSAQTENVSLIN